MAELELGGSQTRTDPQQRVRLRQGQAQDAAPWENDAEQDGPTVDVSFGPGNEIKKPGSGRKKK